MGVVELEGVRRRVHLGFVDGVQIGDYVLVHAGCAVERLDPRQAEEDLALLLKLLEETAPNGPPEGTTEGDERGGLEPR